MRLVQGRMRVQNLRKILLADVWHKFVIAKVVVVTEVAIEPAHVCYEVFP